MKQISAIVILVALLGMLTVAFPSMAQNSDLTTTVTRNANMRSGPETTFDVVKVLTAGTSIRLDGRTETGNWVRGITSSGVIGWISSGTVDITLGDLTTLRIVTADMPFDLSAPAAPQSSGSSGEGETGLSITPSARVNVRSGPHATYRRVDGLELGEIFNVDGKEATNVWVRGITPRRIVGWVHTSYVNITADQLAALPVVTIDTPFNLSAPAGAAAPVVSDAPEVDEAPPVVSTSAVSGFNLGGHVADFSENAANWMRVAGMTWVKVQIRYADGKNPNDVAGLINDTHARGFRILLGINGYQHELTRDGYTDRYAAFVAGVAGLGADAIEVWNEPNIAHEWPSGQINPQAYTNLLRTAYYAIKNANPNTMVVSAAPAPTGFFGGCSGYGCDDDDFIAGMAAAGAANYADCIGLHYNEGIVPPNWTSGDPRGNSSHYTRYFRSMMDVYYGAFRGAKPLCFTELGYLTPDGYGPLSAGFAWAADVSLAEQAAWLDMAVSMARSSGRVRLMIIWNVDFTNYGADPMAGYAIIRPGNICPACQALGS